MPTARILKPELMRPKAEILECTKWVNAATLENRKSNSLNLGDTAANQEASG